MKKKELSIIVPIYNVEQYIQTCLDSIYKQNIEETRFEIILINDGTEDRSMEVIADMIENHQNIIVINQKNQGLSVARNNGVDIAKGEYILFVDADDKLIDNSLKPLLERAITSGADLIMADFYKAEDNSFASTYFTSLPKKIETKEKNAKQMYKEDLVPEECYVVRTLYRKAFLTDNNIQFVPGITYEDQPFSHECYLKAKKCIRAPWPFYVYRINRPAAITSSFDTKKAMDMCISIAKSWELTYLHGTDTIVLRKLKDNIFDHFMALSLLLAHDINNTPNRNHIIDFIRKKVPDMKFENGFKQKTVSILFRKFPHYFIHLRYLYGKYWENTLRPFYYHKIKKNAIKANMCYMDGL